MQKRSNWKGPFMDFFFLEKIRKKQILWATSRSIIIVPALLGKFVHVYNGKSYMPLIIRENMLGYRLGEFIPTRTRHIYKKKKKKKQNSKNKI